MSDFMDALMRIHPQPPPAMPAPSAPPPRAPAGEITPILRSELTDATDPAYLASLVTSSGVTEADIDRAVFEALQAQAAQDDLVEEGGRLIGLRVSEVRPPPQEMPRPQPKAPASPVTEPYI